MNKMQEFKRYLKSTLKQKVNITIGLVISLLLGSGISMASGNVESASNVPPKSETEYCNILRAYGITKENDKTCEETFNDTDKENLDYAENLNKNLNFKNIIVKDDTPTTYGTNNIQLGYDNITIGEQNSNIGVHNIVNGVKNNIVGDTNTVRNSGGVFIGGGENNVEGSSASIVGNANMVTSSSGTINGNTNFISASKATISGNNNDINSFFGVLNGNKNTVRNANGNIFGENNKITNTLDSVEVDLRNITIMGDNNIYDNYHTIIPPSRRLDYKNRVDLILGNNNVLNTTMSEGYNDWINDDVLFKYSDIIESTNKLNYSRVIYGVTNAKDYADNPNSVIGSYNKNIFYNSLVRGSENEDLVNANVFGNHNDTIIFSSSFGNNNINIGNSWILGNENRNVRQSAVFGNRNDVKNSNVVGDKNNTNSGALIFGIGNTNFLTEKKYNNPIILKKILNGKAKLEYDKITKLFKKKHPDAKIADFNDSLHRVTVDSPEITKNKELGREIEDEITTNNYEMFNIDYDTHFNAGVFKNPKDGIYYVITNIGVADRNNEIIRNIKKYLNIDEATDIKYEGIRGDEIDDDIITGLHNFVTPTNIMIGNYIQNGTKNHPTDVVDSITLGYNSTPHSHALSIGNDFFARKLVNMEKGDINETSTDGINGSQLYALMNAKDENGIEINVPNWKDKLGINDKLDKDFNNYDINNNISVATKLSDGANLDTPKGILVTDTLVKEKLDTKFDKTDFTNDNIVSKLDKGAILESDTITVDGTGANRLIGNGDIKFKIKDKSITANQISSELLNKINKINVLDDNYIRTDLTNVTDEVKNNLANKLNENVNIENPTDNGALVKDKDVKKYVESKLSNVATNESVAKKLDKDFNNYDTSNNKTVATKLSNGANLDTPKGILITDTLVKEKLDTKLNKSDLTNENIVSKLEKGSITSEDIVITNGDNRILGGSDLTLAIKDGSINKNKLDDTLKNVVNNIGVGTISDTDTTNNDKTVTGNTVKEYIENKLSNVATNESVAKKLDKDFNNYDTSKNKAVATKLSDGANLDKPKGILITDTLVKEKLDTKVDKANVYTKDETYNKREIDDKFQNIDFSKINNEVDKLKGGVANAMAVAGLPQVNYNSSFSIGAATGYYDKTAALALGVSGQTTNHRIIYKVAASINTSKKIGLNAGINYNFGDINENNKNMNLKEQNDKLAKQEQEIQELKEQLSKLANRNNELDYVIYDFELNKYNLSEKHMKEIDDLLTKINNYTQITITGYADTKGEDKYNLDLGLNRANSVKDYLVSKGIDENSIIIKSSGYNTILGHDNSRNRRVEIIIK